MRLGVWISLMWTVALAATVRPACAEILAQALPVKYNLTVTPGQPLSRDIAIRNLGTAAVVVRVRLSDWAMNEAGELDLVPENTTPHSLYSHVKFEPSEFSLGPGESGVVHLTLRLPPEGPATRWGVILSEVRPAVWPKVALGPRAIAELGTTVYLSRIPAELTRAELTGMELRAVGDSTFAVTLRVRNPGERHLYSTNEIAVTDSTGAKVAGAQLGTGVVLPGAIRNFTWTCDSRVAPGRYTVTASLDTGEPELIIGETVLNWPLSAPARPPVAQQDEDSSPPR